MQCRGSLPWTKLNSFVSLPSIIGCATMAEVTRLRRNMAEIKKGEGLMIGSGKIITAGFVAAVLALAAGAANAKDKVKVGFIGPLTGGVSVNGIGGRNSAELAVKLKNANPATKYNYELVALDDECKPNVGVQVATRAGLPPLVSTSPPKNSSCVVSWHTPSSRWRLPPRLTTVTGAA